jgi:hypothetical protein
MIEVVEMTTTASKDAKQNEHESVNETVIERPFRLLVSVASAFANEARDADWSDDYWRSYWNGVIQGIRAANGEFGAREEAEYVISLAKKHIAEKV